MELVDQVYEAAFIPEYWPKVLDGLAQSSGSVSGALLVIDPDLPPLWSATENVADLVGAFAATPAWYANSRLKRMLVKDHGGFMRLTDFSTLDQLRADHCNAFLSLADLAGQAATVVPMPTGETVLFTLERTVGMENYSIEDLQVLDGVRPHLARASLIASRLKLQQAQSTVAGLSALGLAAAIVSERGRVIAVNDIFESQADFLKPGAHGQLRVTDRRVDALIRAAFAEQSEMGRRALRSIPVPAEDGQRAPAVIHLVPLLRDARDVFDLGATLVVLTGLSGDAQVPDDAILRGLFDLTAAEAAVAAALARGMELKDIAAERGIGITTVRTHLAQVFHKTGTGHQAQLVALLKGVNSGVF